jgi:hypothetical protein
MLDLNRPLPYLYLIMGLLTIAFTFLPNTEQQFNRYYFEICLTYDYCQPIFNFSPTSFRILLTGYYLIIIFLVLKLGSSRKRSNRREVLSSMALTIPLLFYVLTIQNPLITLEYWERILPFYSMPQNYEYIRVDYFRLLTLLFLINLLCLLLFIRKIKVPNNA